MGHEPGWLRVCRCVRARRSPPCAPAHWSLVAIARKQDDWPPQKAARPEQLWERGSRLESPVHMAVVGHRFVYERVKIWIVILECLTRVDGMRGVVRRSVLTERIEVGQHATGPVGGAI